MNPIEFLKTLYFGDRFCTKIVIDGCNNKFEFHVDAISRTRDATGQWNYYFDEDVENGIVVVSDIKKCILIVLGLFQTVMYMMFTPTRSMKCCMKLFLKQAM